MVATNGAGTAYFPEHPSLPTGFQWRLYYAIFSFMCNLIYIVVCPFVLFLLIIVQYVLLRLTAAHFPFWYLQTLLEKCCYLRKIVHRFDFSFHTCMFLLNIVVDADQSNYTVRGRSSCDFMAVGFITTCAISSYHH